MNFKISVKEGKKFSELSGDNNLIHLDDLIGYNSIFGEKICNGCLIILKIFKIINLRKKIKNIDKFSLKIIFLGQSKILVVGGKLSLRSLPFSHASEKRIHLFFLFHRHVYILQIHRYKFLCILLGLIFSST